jgi:hypothetical protein
MMLSTECTQINTVLDSRRTLPSEAALHHLNQCPHCRTLYDWMSAVSPTASISRAREQRIAHTLQMSLPPVKPLPPLRTTIGKLIVLFVTVSAGFIAVMGTAGIARASLTQLFGIAVLLTAGMCVFSAMLAKQMRPGSYQPLPWQMVLAAIGLALLTSMGVLFPWDIGPRFVAQGLPCLLAGVSMAVPAAALLWVVLRRGAPLAMIATGATLGATAGLVGVAALQVKCPHQEAPHLLVWHGSVLLATSGGGVLLSWLAQRASDNRSRLGRQGI